MGYESYIPNATHGSLAAGEYYFYAQDSNNCISPVHGSVILANPEGMHLNNFIKESN